MEGNDTDPELAEIRARRIEQLRKDRAASAMPPPAPPPPTRPTDLTAGTFTAFLGAHPRVVVDVWAPWCGPCRTMAPILDGLATELAPAVSFAKLNADDEPGLASQFGVEGIPTLLLFERGRLLDRVVGAYPKEPLRQHLRSVYRLGS